MKDFLANSQNYISEFCKRNGIKKLSYFGSVLRENFSETSDIDILVEFDSDSIPTLFDIVGMEQELSSYFGGRKVDIRTPEDLSQYFRQQVMENSEIQYVQR